MTTNSFTIVGFDLDGTLVDSSGDLTAAVNDTLGFAGRPLLTIEQVKTMVGGGAKHMLAQGLEATGGCTPEDFRPLYKRMLDYYGAHLSVHTRPFPGVIAALDRLDALGIRSAVVTNKFESFALTLLGDLGLADRFACIIGGDTMGPGLSKPNRAPIDEMIRRCGGGKAAFVGDSIYDIMAATNAGIPAIAVRFGFLLEPVEAMGADAILDSFDDLLPTLERLSA
jgi:phosphoglycolate phosphatase